MSKKTYNLLDRGLFQRLSRNPGLIREEVLADSLQGQLICIDEIQKLPNILDEVHLLIEDHNMRFLLTGPSAKKLKRSNLNLLGGRARTRNMRPFTYKEIDDFNLLRAINHGLLPFHYLADNPDEDLFAYTGRYLAEEIAAEGISRNIPAFSRFLSVAAVSSGELVNYTNIGNDADVAKQTVRHWYQVLLDTLIAFEVPAYKKSIQRKAIGVSKFFLFDTGIVRTLRNLPTVAAGSKDFGNLFEHFIAMELKAYLDYLHPRGTLEYWRSTSGFEVDFILNGKYAIEVKSSNRINRKHLRGLKAFMKEKQMERYILICMEESPRIVDGIEVLPWEVFLKRLWKNEI